MSLRQVHTSLEKLVERHSQEIEKLHKRIKKLNIENKLLRNKATKKKCLYSLVLKENDEICSGIFNDRDIVLKSSLEMADALHVNQEVTIQEYPVYGEPGEEIFAVYYNGEEGAVFAGIKHDGNYYPPEIKDTYHKVEKALKINVMDNVWKDYTCIHT